MIFHDSQNLYYRSPIGAVPTQSFVRLAIDVDNHLPTFKYVYYLNVGKWLSTNLCDKQENLY